MPGHHTVMGIDLRWLVKTSHRLSVTFHTVLAPKPFDTSGCLKALFRGEFRTATDAWRDYRRHRVLSLGVARLLRQQQPHKQVTAIAHNRRDAADLKYLYGIEQVLDHPLAFLSPAEVETVQTGASRRIFATLDHLPDDAVTIGVFGFLNDYKGRSWPADRQPLNSGSNRKNGDGSIDAAEEAL